MPQFILANYCLDHLCKALGVLPERTKRVVIDAKAGSVVVAYVEMFGTDELLEVMPAMVAGTGEIRFQPSAEDEGKPSRGAETSG